MELTPQNRCQRLPIWLSIHNGVLPCTSQGPGFLAPTFPLYSFSNIMASSLFVRTWVSEHVFKSPSGKHDDVVDDDDDDDDDGRLMKTIMPHQMITKCDNVEAWPSWWTKSSTVAIWPSFRKMGVVEQLLGGLLPVPNKNKCPETRVFVRGFKSKVTGSAANMLHILTQIDNTKILLYLPLSYSRTSDGGFKPGIPSMGCKYPSKSQQSLGPDLHTKMVTLR